MIGRWVGACLPGSGPGEVIPAVGGDSLCLLPGAEDHARALVQPHGSGSPSSQAAALVSHGWSASEPPRWKPAGYSGFLLACPIRASALALSYALRPCSTLGSATDGFRISVSSSQRSTEACSADAISLTSDMILLVSPAAQEHLRLMSIKFMTN